MKAQDSPTEVQKTSGTVSNHEEDSDLAADRTCYHVHINMLLSICMMSFNVQPIY